MGWSSSRVLAVALMVGGCAGADAPRAPDSARDVGAADVGSPDADAGSADTGLTDAGLTDAGATDAGLADARISATSTAATRTATVQDAARARVLRPPEPPACDDGFPEPDLVITAAPRIGRALTSTLDASDDIDVVQIDVVDTVYLTAQSFTPGGLSCAPGVDTRLRLLSATCVELGSDDDDGPNECSRIQRVDDGFARLTAGTYYLTIEEDGRDAVAGPYELLMFFYAGDVCGDGIAEHPGGEQCDDGNTASGDGCSATCQFEPAAVVPVPGPPFVLDDVLLNRTDIAVVELDVAVTSWVRAETFSLAYPSCEITVDTLLHLTQPDGTPIASNDDGGPSVCSILVPDRDPQLRLEPGRYFVVVATSRSGSTMRPFQLRVTSAPVGVCGNGHREEGEPCDAGGAASIDGCTVACTLAPALAEIEPNDSLAAAHVSGLVGAGVRTLTGAISSVGDVDHFSFVVPPGAHGLSLRARTYSVPGDVMSTCDDAIDTRLALVGVRPTPVGALGDLDGPANRCSGLDGTLPSFGHPDTMLDGVSPFRDLAPGTYALMVGSTTVTQPYQLHLELVQE